MMVIDNVVITGIIALQINNLLSPATKEIGRLIAHPLIRINRIRNKEDVKATKESFICICNKLDAKNSKNLSYIPSVDIINMKSIYQVLDALKFCYDDDSVQTELLYEILFKLITAPTKEEDELLHTKLLDNLYQQSLSILYLIYTYDALVLENKTEWVLTHNDQDIKPIQYLENNMSYSYEILHGQEDKIKYSNISKLLYNKKDVTEKFKYINNLQEYHLISNYELKEEPSDIKRLLFIIDNKELITFNTFRLITRYKYFLTDKGKEIIQYYNSDVIEKIVSDFT
jgi:hypothetical protein